MLSRITCGRGGQSTLHKFNPPEFIRAKKELNNIQGSPQNIPRKFPDKTEKFLAKYYLFKTLVKK